MIEKATSNANIASMLQTLRAHQSQASGGVQGLAQGQGQEGVQKSGFADAVRQMVSQVNEAQTASSSRVQAYERGEDIPLTDVVLGMQKASLSFEATLQVRNKVLKAYEDIINMPV